MVFFPFLFLFLRAVQVVIICIFIFLGKSPLFLRRNVIELMMMMVVG